MKEYTYWRIAHRFFGKLDETTKWFRVQNSLCISLRQINACQKANLSLDFSPAMYDTRYANKEIALEELELIRKHLTKKAAKQFYLVKVKVKVKEK
jgi:hypothetical protein